MDKDFFIQELEAHSGMLYRVALIAALIIMSLTAVAFPAGSIMGWNDFYGRWHGSTGVPKGVYEQMQVGPLTFTIEHEVMIGVDALPDVITLTDDVLPETIPGDAPVVMVAK